MGARWAERPKSRRLGRWRGEANGPRPGPVMRKREGRESVGAGCQAGLPTGQGPFLAMGREEKAWTGSSVGLERRKREKFKRKDFFIYKV